MNWNKPTFFSEEFMGKWIFDRLQRHETIVTPMVLIKDIKHKTGYTTHQAKTLIFNLVSAGELEYLDVYGRTCLLPSFSRPINVSQRIVLKPPECTYTPEPGEEVININKGIAFGRGTHPTTVLSIRALNLMFDQFDPSVSMALDIGTGTCVLALVAARLGAIHVDACDIDPVSIHEARQNVMVNQLEDRICVSDSCDLSKCYELIIANLRYPTLISLKPQISAALSEKGWVVLSGIKNEELDKVRTCYGQNMDIVHFESERGWSSLICQNNK